jgi:hypothetical protein
MALAIVPPKLLAVVPPKPLATMPSKVIILASSGTQWEHVTPIYRSNGMHTLMCAQRSITHKFTNYNRSIITKVITSRYLNT